MPRYGYTSSSIANLAEEVRAGLDRPGQKELPCKLLYDEVGSALFEVISLLPEYGLTAADARLLETHAEEIVARVGDCATVAELGSGSGRKTRHLLEALCRSRPTTYYPIEISPAALARCEQELGRIGGLSIAGIERPYLEGLQELGEGRGPEARLFLLFLGSSIGNFDHEAGDAFLREVRRCLRPGDALLLGTDLLKPVETLLLAYDDPLGVTAAFNLNLLARINQALGANFALAKFRHLVRYVEEMGRIEMHLLSTEDQLVAIPGAGLEVRLAKGETIWTESCHKYTEEELVPMASRAGFRCEAQWVDRQWPFAQNLWRAV